MGFEDNFTRISWEGRPEEECPDMLRYMALGNSMAVPVMRWLGERIEMVDQSASNKFREKVFGNGLVIANKFREEALKTSLVASEKLLKALFKKEAHSLLCPFLENLRGMGGAQ
jgi:hypothetical protein